MAGSLQAAAEIDDQELFKTSRLNYLGTVRIPLSAIHHHRAMLGNPRAISCSKVGRLKKIFHHEGCRRWDPKNYISALVEDTTFQVALRRSALNADSIRSTATTETIPQLHQDSGIRVQCLQGRHRIAAATEYLEGDDRWWMVKLFQQTADVRLQTQLEEEYENSVSYPDGEVFRKIRWYQQQNEKLLEGKWWARLTDCKQRGLRQVLRHPGLIKAFDKLLDFPGLWAHIPLGNFPRVLTVKCDEEIIHYLEHVYQAWTCFTCGRPSLQEAVDAATVEALQLRAPAASRRDRRWVSAAIQDKTIFPTVYNTQDRREIEAAILEFGHLVPSVDTLFKNLGYLEVCAKILKQEVLDPTPRMTVRQALVDSCSTIGREIPMETHEGQFVNYRARNSAQAHAMVVHQLWLFCMRHFPHLSNTAPKKERGKEVPCVEATNPVYRFQLATLAHHLGIRTSKVQKTLVDDPDREIASRILSHARPQLFYGLSQVLRETYIRNILVALPGRELRTTNPLGRPRLISESGESLERRYGRPYENAYKVDKSCMFLPNFTYEEEEQEGLGEDVSSFYVRREIFYSFFGLPRLGLQQPNQQEDDDPSHPPNVHSTTSSEKAASMPPQEPLESHQPEVPPDATSSNQPGTDENPTMMDDREEIDLRGRIMYLVQVWKQ
ncbi:MAG: hypothetical protein M1823_004244 [Watsoniomyces obsoletus]|nr:MAG: hypothetical protein M1823_004244 [Watsoniomyces obsoletus]